jgi:hypothetical protein
MYEGEANHRLAPAVFILSLKKEAPNSGIAAKTADDNNLGLVSNGVKIN